MTPETQGLQAAAKKTILASLPSVVVVDIKTSGLLPGKHSILQIGALRMGHEGMPFVEPDVAASPPQWSMSCRCWEITLPHGTCIRAEYDANVLKTNGRSVTSLYDASTYEEESITLGKFYNWLGEGPFLLAGMNPAFTYGFLRAASYRANIMNPFELSGHFLDLHTLAIAWTVAKRLPAVPRGGLEPNAIYRMLALDTEPRDALTSARIATRAILRILADLFPNAA